jgi:LPS export ABC transporter protein LptC
MRRVPLVILAGVLVFVSVIVVSLVARSRGPRVHPPEPVASKADYRIKEVHLQEEDPGKARWQLDAESGEMFENQQKTVMQKVTIQISERGRDWTVTGDVGELARDTRDVELRGHVVVVSSDGLRLETTRLNWTAKDQRAWTDQPVTVWRPGVVVRGLGFESRVNEEVTTIKGRLRATLSAGAAALKGRGRRS